MIIKIHLKSLFACFVLACLSIYAGAQNKITGTVFDSGRQPLAGAGVVVKGTSSLGVTTDVNGNFSLDVPSNSILEVSFIGYETKEIQVGKASHYEIELNDDKLFLDETVVIGYGTVKKRDLTGSVSNIKAEDVVAVPTVNALESLQGKIAGLDMTKGSGSAGSGVSFTIRGHRSLNASNAPLILVDGVPYGEDVDINPSNIQSIEVLKDASSTAIYGSRGANGVIIITTKKGATDKTRVSYNGYYSFDSMYAYPDLMNTQQYADFHREAAKTSGKWKSEADDAQIFGTDYQFIKDDVNIDWIGLVTRPGYTTSHSVAVSHGGKKTKFNASVQYMNQKGIIYNDDFSRLTGNLSVSHNILDNLVFDASLIVGSDNNNIGQEPFVAAVNYGAWGVPYDKEGNIVIYPYLDNQTISPIAEQIPGNYVNNVKKYRMYASAGLAWTVVDGLTLKTNVNLNTLNARTGQYFGRYTYKQSGSVDKASAQNDMTSYFFWNATADYHVTFANDHDLSVMAGAELQRNLYEMYYAEGRDLLSNQMSFHSLQSLQSQQAIKSQYTKSSMASFFGRVNYKFKNRYLLSATIRYDGASQLAEGHKWGFFPSVAGAWVVSEEPFMQSASSWLDNLKLRASWGVSGNSAVDPYQTAGGLGATMYVFDTNNTEVPQFGYWPRSMSNHELGWEKTSGIDIGVDFSVLKNRIDLTVDYYLQNTSDLLMQKQIPVTTGYVSTWDNVGKTRNSGIEVTLSTKNIVSKMFSWSSDLTFTKNHEEIVELASGQDRDIASGWFVGYPTSVHYALLKTGIWQTNEAEEAAKFGYKPGQVKNADLKEDGVIDADDRTIIGTNRPDFTIGFNNRFRIGDFGLSAFIIWRHGSMFNIYNCWKIIGKRRCFSYVDYWTPDNPTNEYPRPDDSFSDSHISLGGLNYVDGSFLKVRDISLEYFVPNRATNKIGISDMKVYCTLKNFFQINNLPCSGYDAEKTGEYSIPTTKEVVLGLNINF